MSYSNVSGSLFKKMVTNGAINLRNHYKEVDTLNVFPVPDGDTGTNMSMTMMSGINEIESNDSNSLSDISKVLSRGFLMGARGNSGVILSQYFRGIYLGLKNIKGSNATINELVDTLTSGNKIAYQAVMTPVEGTILTVMREAGEYIDNNRSQYKTVDQVLKDYLDKAKESLANTPNILPVLKEAKVVDSGGAGFVYVVEGMYLASVGKMLEMIDEENEEVQEEIKEEEKKIEEVLQRESKFMYQVDYDIMLKDPNNFVEADLRSPLSIIGDSLIIDTKEDNAHVNFFTNNPGRALNMGQRHGEFKKVSIVNVKIQSEPDPKEETELAEYGIIAVCYGDGIKETFTKLGADVIIDGGQSMNPSTSAFVEAVNSLNAKNILIIPNNSNVIMSANQTKELCEGKNIEVIKTKNFAHGFVALANFDPDNSLEENITSISEALENVSAIEVTYSVRDTELNGLTIKEGDQIAILDDKIVASNVSRLAVIKKALMRSIKSHSIMVTVFKGLDGKDEEIEEIKGYVEMLNSDCDVEVIDGKQDIYSYIICVE